MTNDFTQKQLFGFVRYDPETGIFSSVSTRHLGKPIGVERHGYWYVSICGRAYRAARLAWFYVHGTWPKNHIDHINGDRRDDRIANLRDVPRQANNQNIHRPFKTNKTGFLGVDLEKKSNRYRASIRHNGKNRTLGRFKTPEEAHEVYLAAKRRLHEGCTL
jgi:hypothetical protein